ncbi:MAG TPA: hypothetical protein EYP85_10595 [Armatimonadetes bacterium]|nr:hypothetical protein [Armatimonadota bacterium]
MTIREYLCREARRITRRALRDLTDAATWERERPRRLAQYYEMMGLTEYLAQPERPPLNVRVVGRLERPGYRIERLYFESLPRLYVVANLYLPDPLDAPAPGVLYVCGHSETQKVHYQAHPRKFAQLGFVALIVETIQLGEVRGYHHGPYYEGWFHWYSRGYTPAGVELWNGIRALDLLQSRPEVEGTRLGVTGISGGGAMSWWLGAADERVKVVAPVCGTATFASHICERTLDGHCDCMFPLNTYRWDLIEVGALIAPRPLLIASSDRDAIFTIASIREVYTRLKRLYELLGAGENLRLVETPGPHSYHERSRRAIFAWFVRHLQGKEVSPEEVGDLDESPAAQEPAENLRVYVSDPPPDDRTTTIQDDFVSLASPPKIPDATALRAQREQLIAALREKTFGAFPSTPCDLEVQVEMELDTGGWRGCRFGFTSEEGWRLHGRLLLAQEAARPAPTVVMLRRPREPRLASENFLNGLDNCWARAIVEPRGTGETAWGPELDWHVRRAAALIGRTVASMRVYDALRALEAMAQLEGVDRNRLALAGEGEMAAVALYAALLSGQVQAVILGRPPATQNAPSSPDGTGPAIEMLNCLRYTDLPQVAGLLWPMELVFVGPRPETYRWAEELYARLGPPGAVRHVKRLDQWAPRAGQ